MALILPAYAKLNLTLDVTGRRPNGYHDIDSVMQTISLHDLIWIERTDCRVFDLVGPAIAGENLVLKAARELEGHVSRQLPFTIRLVKRIPIGAGLGGGSADAAAFFAGTLEGVVERESDQRVDLVWPRGARLALELHRDAAPGVDRLEVEGLRTERTVVGTRFVPLD